jgi:ribosomal-protein-alanine N-acetyltransferase
MTFLDIPQVVELDRMSFSLPWSERSYRFEILENDCSRCWVVESGGMIVGMLVLWLIVDEAHIATLAVHPAHRRRGFAGMVLREALKSAYTEGARCATLEVRAGNMTAQALYDKFGFEVVGRRPHYYKDNQEDALLLTLRNLENPEEFRD